MSRSILKGLGVTGSLVAGMTLAASMKMLDPQSRSRKRMGRRNEIRKNRRHAMNKIARRSRKVNRRQGR